MQGRACMIAACEKNKFVYVLNRDNEANLTISSPLEAHKARHVVFAICGLDCGFENPVFAAIELDYENADQVRCAPVMMQFRHEGRCLGLDGRIGTSSAEAHYLL